jgi:hypothetical protein
MHGRQIQLPLLVDDPPPERPRNRRDCRYGVRPCPWVGCRFALYLDVLPSGRIKLAFPLLEPGELRETCALDVADRGPAPVSEIGALVGVTPERIRQIEGAARARLRVLMQDEFEEEGKAMAAKKAKKQKSNGFAQAKLASVEHVPMHKGKPREDAIVRRRFKERCPVKIPTPDVEKKADLLARQIQERDAVKEEQSEANKGFREQLNEFDVRIKELAESVRSHSEIRDVPCVEFFLEKSGGMVIVRQDTGEQVGEERAANAEDRQDKLPLSEDEAPDDDIPFGDLAGDQDEAGEARAGDEI